MMLTTHISIVIPVYNGGPMFLRCLSAIRQSSYPHYELIVVDDGSTDGSGQFAVEFGARLLHTEGRRGPAYARNLGAQAAYGDYLFFTDADCAIHPDTLQQAVAVLEAKPELAAFFGSYDDAPAAPNFVAQYKNLFHHYVHQTSPVEATTFWTGCGIIRRTLFLDIGGFDHERYPQPAIEDIELGYRLWQRGAKIRLVKTMQVTHLKAWSLIGLVKTDIFQRGLPWTALILEHRAFGNNLNLQTHNRLSVVAVYMLLATLVGLRWERRLGWLGLGAAGLLLRLNWPLYQFFQQRRGWWFATRAVPLHWLYYAYNGVSFGVGLMLQIIMR